MTSAISPSTKALGFWSAVFATVLSIAYDLGQITPFDSYLYSVDILGYSFMSIATLLAARVLTGDGLERRARLFLTANGLLLPFLALQIYFHWLIWIAALWAVTFPGSTWTIAVLFRRAGTTPAPTLAGRPLAAE